MNLIRNFNFGKKPKKAQQIVKQDRFKDINEVNLKKAPKVENLAAVERSIVSASLKTESFSNSE